MLKKMQRRFILAAMAAFGTVTLLLLAGINLLNYYRTTLTQDEMVQNLLRREQRLAGHPDAAPPPVGDMPMGGPEAEFTTRFFTVHCDPEGRVRFVSRDHIFSIDEETAAAYGEAVLEKGREKGYYGAYRYGVIWDKAGVTVLFLNAAGPMQYMRSLFWASLAIGAASLAVVFVLVVFFSRYAIRPYVKNMERQKRFITDAGHELLHEIRRGNHRAGMPSTAGRRSELDAGTPFPHSAGIVWQNAVSVITPQGTGILHQGAIYLRRRECEGYF